jgi:type III secretory pathway component EscV
MVRRYLDTFVGVQETEEMLQKWLTDTVGTETPYESLQRAIPTSTERIRLVQALQRLVRQKIPVIRIDSILAAFERGRAKGESMLDLVEGLRRALKDDLPGRDDDRLLVGVGDWEAPIRQWVVRQNGSSFLALDAGEEHEFEALLGAVRGTLGEDDRRAVALVVEDHTLRPFVQQAIEGRFADVVVVSETELNGARVDLRLPSEGVLVEAQA